MIRRNFLKMIATIPFIGLAKASSAKKCNYVLLAIKELQIGQSVFKEVDRLCCEFITYNKCMVGEVQMNSRMTEHYNAGRDVAIEPRYRCNAFRATVNPYIGNRNLIYIYGHRREDEVF